MTGYFNLIRAGDPEPRDLIHENIGKNTFSVLGCIKLRALVFRIASYWLLFFWLIPVTAIAALQNLGTAGLWTALASDPGAAARYSCPRPRMTVGVCARATMMGLRVSHVVTVLELAHSRGTLKSFRELFTP